MCIFQLNSASRESTCYYSQNPTNLPNFDISRRINAGSGGKGAKRTSPFTKNIISSARFSDFRSDKITFTIIL